MHPWGRGMYASRRSQARKARRVRTFYTGLEPERRRPVAGGISLEPPMAAKGRVWEEGSLDEGAGRAFR